MNTVKDAVMVNNECLSSFLDEVSCMLSYHIHTLHVQLQLISKLCGAQYSTSIYKPKSSTVFRAHVNQCLYKATKRWHSSQVCSEGVMTVM